MKFVVAAVLAGLAVAPFAGAQKLELKFEALAAKASDKSEVDVDGAALKLLRHLQPKDRDAKDNDNAPLADLLNGIEGVHIRNYEFAERGAYSDKDLEPLRKQMSEASGWSRIMNVRDHDDNVEVFVQSAGAKIGSCVILAAEPRELSVVYVRGTLTLAQAKQLATSDALSSLAEMK